MMLQKSVRCPGCLFAVLLVCCQPHRSSQAITIEWFVESFINPVSFDAPGRQVSTIPFGQWDSLVRQAIKTNSSSPGVFTAILNDSSAAPYTVGYMTPSNIRTDTTYPLIIYLHGGTGSLLSTKGEKAYDMLRPLADTFALFLASPSANRAAPWWSPAGINRIMQTLRFMTLHYPINPEKIFLAGVSDGAMGCYAAANAIPSLFAGFFAVSGFGGMLPQVSMELLPANIMQRPIYNVNAGKDRIYDINEVNKFLDWLIDKGARIDRKEHPDEMHGFDYRFKEFGTMAQYIRTWRKPTDINGVHWTIVPGFPNRADNLIDYRTDTISSVARISAYWKSDTFFLTTVGFSEVLLSFPSIDKTKILVSVNKAKPRVVNVCPLNVQLSYRLMQHDCFPIASEAKCYRIKF